MKKLLKLVIVTSLVLVFALVLSACQQAEETPVPAPVEETTEAREQTVEWEMRQLGIMDWITNDVDWMTGDVHADVKRLAWHN